MGAPKPLILPWLRAQLDRGGYPGVRWLGATRFRVPWKHGLRHDVAPEDFQLFQDWAIASGCYRPGVDPPAPAVWKRNFRAALNRKPGLRVVEDRSGDAGDPHKVYEFLPGGPGGAGDPPEVYEFLPGALGGASGAGDPPETYEFLPGVPGGASGAGDPPEVYEFLPGVPGGAGQPPRAGDAGPAEPPEASGGDLELLEPELDCGQDWDLDEVMNMLVLDSPEEDVAISLLAPAPDDAPDPPVLPPDPPYCPPEDAMGLGPPPQPGCPLPDLLIGADELKTDLEVRVYYRGRAVLQTTVAAPGQLLLVAPGTPGTPVAPGTVALPEPAVADGRQARYTRRVLRGLGAGVGLRARGPGLEGARLGCCRVFWGRGGTPGPGPPRGALPKGTYGPLYGLRDFVRELIAFMEGGGESPQYELWLCLGEPWPEPGHSWTRKLIMVQVVPVALRLLHELSRAQGASSLRSSELQLQLSASLGEGGLLGALRSWDERMDSLPSA